jgi:hypothetical protein
MAPSCALDADGLRQQLDRYRQVGRHARLIERAPRRLVVDLDEHLDSELLERAIAIERECCPFFDLDLDLRARRLAVSVSDTEHEPALEAILFALALEASGHDGSD